MVSIITRHRSDCELLNRLGVSRIWEALASGTQVYVHEWEEFILLQREVEISFQFRILGAGKHTGLYFYYLLCILWHIWLPKCDRMKGFLDVG